MSYLRRVPAKDAVIANKRVSPAEWLLPDEQGNPPTDPGYFLIPAFTRQDRLDAIRAEHTTRITAPTGVVTEKVDNRAYLRAVVAEFLKGWGNVVDPDTGAPVPFTPEEVAALTDDTCLFLVGEIANAGRGLLTAADVVTKDEVTGQPLDRKSPDPQVPGGDAQA